MRRELLAAQVEETLGTRQLIWFGTRGDDIESCADLPQLSSAFSIIGAYGRRSTVASTALEDLSGVRVDLDAHDIDGELSSAAVKELRRGILRALAQPCFVFTYRPSVFLSAICFARRDRCKYLGLFKDHQAAFEHKPWVETQVAGLGLPHIPWTYVADEDQVDTLRFLDDGPVMLRKSRTSGGTGFVRLDEGTLLGDAWPEQEEGFVSVAPFIEGGVPLNVGGVVWRDGVTVHPPSVQLIGVPSCTTRPFGYCGNDFSAVKDMGLEVVTLAERSVELIGDWLSSFGYRGAFGVDFLIKDGVPLFTEVNPRFQGSTHLSSQISISMGESCILLEHLAACLGHRCPTPGASLFERVLAAPPLAHVVAHWTGPDTRGLDAGKLTRALACTAGFERTDVQAPRTVLTRHGATVARVTTRRGLTTSGFDLDPEIDAIVTAWAMSESDLAVGSPPNSPTHRGDERARTAAGPHQQERPTA